MAPERLETSVYGFPSDIWSLGLMLVALAQGRSNPWASDERGEITVFQLVNRMRNGDVPTVPHGFSHSDRSRSAACCSVSFRPGRFSTGTGRASINACRRALSFSTSSGLSIALGSGCLTVRSRIG